MAWVVGVVVTVVLVGTYVTWLAARLDRLHLRAAAARRALESQLVRRAAAAAVLAEQSDSPQDDLYLAARGALDTPGGDREAAENDLSRRLRELDVAAAKAEPALVEAVEAAGRRVVLARQVHSDSVRDALALREHQLVRWLGLARRHTRPAYFDIDV
ncbi:hypothetical protein [Hamadaea tsunoensis]|uniref:hypothetical protein n=1 Tax=Hamadaea tsunoensis TaxID=53368 RepID=UPI0038993662